MLVPGVAVGHGKTLRALISVARLASQREASLKPRRRRSPSQRSAKGVLKQPFLARGLRAAADPDALDVHVHLDDRQAERPLDGEPDAVGNLFRHLGDARAVLDDDVQVDDDPAPDDAHLDPRLHQPSGAEADESDEAAAQPTREPDDAVALDGRSASDRGDRSRRDTRSARGRSSRRRPAQTRAASHHPFALEALPVPTAVAISGRACRVRPGHGPVIGRRQTGKRAVGLLAKAPGVC